MNDPTTSKPHVSIVIPIFNEEGILRSAVTDLVERMKELGQSYELILAENGSRDDTPAIARHLSERYETVRSIHIDEPNYGKALRTGILDAKGEFVVCDEIDLCDIDFHRRALDLLDKDEADLVVGSKVMAGAEDKRPFMRKAGTMVINQLLHLFLGFKGTDTHGLKAFRREAILPVVHQCLVDRDLFASELVIRTERNGIRVMEIPITVVEKRKPSINLVKRVPNVIKNLGRLVMAIRFNKAS